MGRGWVLTEGMWQSKGNLLKSWFLFWGGGLFEPTETKPKKGIKKKMRSVWPVRVMFNVGNMKH